MVADWPDIVKPLCCMFYNQNMMRTLCCFALLVNPFIARLSVALYRNISGYPFSYSRRLVTRSIASSKRLSMA